MFHLVVIFFVATSSALVTCLGVRLAVRLSRRTVATVSISAVVLFGVFLAFSPYNLVFSNLAVLIAVICVGSGIGLLLNTKPALVSFAVVASVADIISVTGGITKSLSESYHEGASNLLLNLSVSCVLDGKVQQVIGIGDLVICASIMFALYRLGYRGLLVFLGPGSGLLVALSVGLMVGGIFGIPFMAATTFLLLILARTGQSGHPGSQ